jgi:TonB family protein
MIGGAPRLLPLVFLTLAMSSLSVGQSQDQSSPPPAQTQDQSDIPQRVRVSSGVSGGLLIRKVNPKYPKEARKKGIQGVVSLSATINQSGDIVSLAVVSGDPLLAQAAIEAAKQWKYRPYMLKGQPVEVQTQIQVMFTLSRN